MKPVIDDPVEAAFIELCDELGIVYERPELHGGRMDFYLPAYGLYVEVKAHSCKRLHAQIESVRSAPVMVLVGVGTVDALAVLLRSLEGK